VAWTSASESLLFYSNISFDYLPNYWAKVFTETFTNSTVYKKMGVPLREQPVLWGE
jgi:hypothetical protein